MTIAEEPVGSLDFMVPILAAFDRLLPYIAEALEEGGSTYTPNDVRRAVQEGALQAWPTQHAILLTQVVDMPQKRVCHFFLAAGAPGVGIEEIEKLYPVVEQWARDAGCTLAVFCGRPGWERTFLTRKAGWAKQAVEYRKDL